MRDIKGFEGLYKINKDGRIWSIRKNKWLKYRNFENRYPTACLWRDKKDYYFYVHRLVALTYIKNPKKLREVNHKNGIKTDNCVENLEWCSQIDNKKHAKLNGFTTRGDRNTQTKLTVQNIKDIRTEYALGKISHNRLGKKYNVSGSSIYMILHRKNWYYV